MKVGVPGGVRVAAWIALLCAALGLVPVVQGTSWVLDVLLATGAVVGTGALLARTRTPLGAVVALQAVALVVVLCFLFTPGEALLGLLPGPAAWRALGVLADSGHQVVLGQSAPVVAVPGIRLLLTLGAGVAALVVDVLAVTARRPALAGLPLLAVHCTAAVFAPGGLSWWWFALAGAGYALLLCADAPARVARWGRMVRGGGRPPRVADTQGWSGAGRSAAAVALVAAVIVPPLVPGSSSSFVLSGGTGGAGGLIDAINPLIDLRSDLQRQGDQEVFSYRTSARDPQPLRVVTVDTFDGQTWRPTTPKRSVRLPASGALGVPPGLTSQTPRRKQHYDVRIGALRQQWLPVPYPATTVDVNGNWSYDPTTLNVLGRSGTRTEEGQQYSVTYLQVTPTSTQLATAGAVPQEVHDTYAQLPQGLPPVISQTAQAVTKDATTPYEKAVALQTYFRSGQFTYSTEAPVPRTASALADFLDSKTGYCVHFASTMAVMARTLGIPARVAIGFLPGTEDPDGTYRVGLDDAHAWPELYFAGAGWVRFEPTPASRTGTAPSWTVPVVNSPTTPQAPSTGASEAPAAGGNRADTSTSEPTVKVKDTVSHSIPWQLPVVVALVAGILAAPLMSRTLISRRRWRRARGPQDRAEAAWADLVEQIGDLGVPVPVAATPRQLGRRLETGGQPDAVHRLVSALEDSRYAAPSPASRGVAGGGEQLAGDVSTVVRSLVESRPRSQTWRWRWLPPSGLAHLRALGRWRPGR